MESYNYQCPMPANPNGEGGSKIKEAKLTLEELVTNEEVRSLNNQLVTYHRRFPDGKYVPVYLSFGFQFNTEDQKLIKYLKKRISNPEASCIFMPSVNVYEHGPEKLAELHPSVGADEWYFFSTRDRKYPNGSRPDRAAGNGYWKATGADKKIYDNGEQIGSKKCLVFYEGKAKTGKKTCWVMHEFVTDQSPTERRGRDDMRLNDCVLCRIYKNTDCSRKRVKQTAASESGPQLSLQEQQPSHPTPQPNLQVLQPNFGNLQMLQSNPPMPHQNLQVLQPNFGNLQMLQSNPPMPHQNLQLLQPKLEPIQYSLQAGSHNLGGLLDRKSESIPEDTWQIHFDNVENSHGSFIIDSIHMEMVGNLTHPPVFGGLPNPHQTINYSNPYQPTDDFNPNDLFIDGYPQDEISKSPCSIRGHSTNHRDQQF